MKLNKTLITGSFILLIAFNLYNAMNFFFHFAMARMLSTADYGVLASMYSIIYMLAVFTESIQTVITKYTSNEKDIGRLRNILVRSFKKSLIVSGILLLVYIILAIPLSYLLKIDYLLLALNGLIVIDAFLVPITRGVMQGRKRFYSLGFNMIVEAVVKLSLAALLVYFGWRVYGAIIGTIIGVFLALIISLISLKDVLYAEESKAMTENIYGYTKPTFFIILTILAFFSIDVVIAKIFFSDELAGSYALASTLSKIIFWGTQPISRAMFPLSSESHHKQEKGKSKNIFHNSLLLLLLGTAVALIIYYSFPQLIVRVFSGRVVEESAGILFYLGLGTAFLSLTNMILLYKLSIGKIKGYQFLISFVIIEVAMLSYFSHSLVEFSLAFAGSSLIFLIGSLLLLNK